MLEKIKSYISTFIADAKVKLNNMQKPIQWIVIGYFILVLLLVLTYYIAWLYLWQGGKAALPDLLAIIKEMNLNNNGVPDRLEDNEQGGGHR